MGSTLEAQKKKAPKPKNKKVTVSPGKPYYSSSTLRSGFETALPSANLSETYKKSSPFGKYSPRAALLTGARKLGASYAPEEYAKGSRLAEKVAKEEIKRNDGGIARKTRVF